MTHQRFRWRVHRRRLAEFLRSHGLIDLDLAGRLLYPELLPDSVARLFARQVTAGVLSRHAVGGGLSYFRMGLALAHRLRLPRERTLAFGPQALARAYGALLAIAGQSNRLRIAPRELAAWQEGLSPPPGDAAYFLERRDEKSAARLGLVRVDYGGSLDARRRAGQVEEELDRHVQTSAAWRGVVAKGRFLYVLVTAHEGRARALRAALRERDVPTPVEVQCFSALVPFTTGVSDA
jgi:hypothetical protein